MNAELGVGLASLGCGELMNEAVKAQLQLRLSSPGAAVSASPTLLVIVFHYVGSWPRTQWLLTV